jgi:aminoglycoside phosphotransferase (APT) family kinase protein
VSLLQKQCGEGKDLSVTSVNALSGGFSKQTIMITLAGNRVLPGDIVVRRDRAESPVGSTVTDEFELLKSLHKAGLAVPQPFAAIDGGTVIGDPIMVVSRIEGRIIGDPYDIFDHKCPGVIPTLARQLARLHRIPLTSLTRALPGNDMSQREHLRGDIDEFRRHWRAEAESSIVIEAAFEWLDARFDQLPDTSRCITHRDMRFHNILVDDKGVSAILDWETATLGRPARDLGFVYRHITQLGDWQQFIDAYREAGGDAPAVAELDFYILWSDLLMTIWMYRARASYLGSGGGNIQLAFAGERMRQHNLRILSETMCNLLLKTQ